MPNMPIDQLIICMIVLSGAMWPLLGDSDLVVMGEIGGNDYYSYFSTSKPRIKADDLILDVITYISHFVEVWR